MVTGAPLVPLRYIYEVMVEPRFQRQGLATHMISLLEEIAWEHCMDKVILTEFTANKPAENLYRRLGYVLDKVRNFCL
jgi:ribosomal protein S18 acetylase RimI-like enzyme